MIAYLKGQIKNKDERSVILLVNNIGYQVNAAEHVLIKSKVGSELEVYTHMQTSQRDDTQELFGFISYEELIFFKKLISISGVGPRSALATLSIAKLATLKETIVSGDPSLLQKVAGIGKKTAERIIIELKDKIKDISGTYNLVDGDLMGALENLGYRAEDIRSIINKIPSDIEDSSERLRTALKLLGK